MKWVGISMWKNGREKKTQSEFRITNIKMAHKWIAKSHFTFHHAFVRTEIYSFGRVIWGIKFQNRMKSTSSVFKRSTYLLTRTRISYDDQVSRSACDLRVITMCLHFAWHSTEKVEHVFFRRKKRRKQFFLSQNLFLQLLLLLQWSNKNLNYARPVILSCVNNAPIIDFHARLRRDPVSYMWNWPRCGFSAVWLMFVQVNRSRTVNAISSSCSELVVTFLMPNASPVLLRCQEWDSIRTFAAYIYRRYKSAATHSWKIVTKNIFSIHIKKAFFFYFR